VRHWSSSRVSGTSLWSVYTAESSRQKLNPTCAWRSRLASRLDLCFSESLLKHESDDAKCTPSLLKRGSQGDQGNSTSPTCLTMQVGNEARSGSIAWYGVCLQWRVLIVAYDCCTYQQDRETSTVRGLEKLDSEDFMENKELPRFRQQRRISKTVMTAQLPPLKEVKPDEMCVAVVFVRVALASGWITLCAISIMTATTAPLTLLWCWCTCVLVAVSRCLCAKCASAHLCFRS